MTDPIFQNLSEHLSIAIGSGYAMMIASYAARTMPKPKNVWALWLAGIAQFALLNLTEGKSNLDTVKGINGSH